MKDDISELLESLSEEEINILKAVNKYGSLKKRDIFRMFANDRKSQKSYCSLTINKMKNKGLLKGNRLGCFLGSKGIRILNKLEIEENYNRLSDKYTKLYKQAELLSKFPNRYILSRIEYLKNFTVMSDKNYTRMFVGVVWDNPNNKELVYLLNGEFNNALNSFINYDAKLTDIYDLVFAIDNINQLISIKERILNFNAKNIKIIPNSEEGILIYDLFRKGYLNDKYLYNFLSKSDNDIDVKFKENILQINGVKVANFLMLNLKNLYKKTERIRYLDEENYAFIFFDFFNDFFNDTSSVFFNSFSTEIANISIKLSDYINFLELNYNYKKFDFNSLSAKTPFNREINI